MRKKVIETTEMLNKQMGDALIELLKEKPISKISIEELTKKADVGRATFFRHFDSKEDLLSYRLVEIYKEYMGDSFDASYSDIFKRADKAMYEYKRRYKQQNPEYDVRGENNKKLLLNAGDSFTFYKLTKE